MNEMDGLVKQKNRLVQDILNRRAANQPVSEVLLLTAAKAEENIADILSEDGDHQRSLVNLISAGSFYMSAGARKEGLSCFARAKRLTRRPEMLKEIERLEADVPA